MTAAVGLYSFQDMKPEQALYTMDAGHTSDRFDLNGSGGHGGSMGGEVFIAEPQTETGSTTGNNLMDRTELQKPQLQVEHSQGFMLLHDAFQLSETATSTNTGYHAPLSPPLARNAAAVLAQMNMHPRNQPQNHLDHPNYLHQDSINQHTLQFYNLYHASPPSSAQISPAIHHPTFSQHNTSSQHPLLSQQNYVPSSPEQIQRPVLDSSYPLQFVKKELPAQIHSQQPQFSRDNLDQGIRKLEETAQTADANETKECDDAVSTYAEGSSDSSKPGKQPTASGKRLTNGKASGIGSDRRPRDHRCGVCHKGFLRKQDLSRHEVTHSSVKAFSCPMGCGTTFGRSDAMARHLKAKRCITSASEGST